MANFFNEIAGGAEKMQAQFLGPTYNYAKNIKSPNDMGMSGDGNMSALSRDITGIIAYTQLLVEGKGNANKKGTPLGNKFYLKTGGQCTSSDGNKHDRYIFVNNVPTGSLPIISNATGQAFGDFRGLIPGTIGNVGEINPLAIFKGFMQGTDPKCRKLGLRDDKGRSGYYVADADIADLDPCLFGGRNPVSGTRYNGCASGFQNMNDIVNKIKEEIPKLQKNPLANIYNLGFGAFVIYLMYHLIRKHGFN